MKIAIFTYTRAGCATAKKIMSYFPESEKKAYTLKRFNEVGFLPLEHPAEPFYGKLFAWAEAMIFVGSCGIAVREIAPHIRDKCTDPAVLCVDDCGKYVIPILSGHIGGAVRLAREIADKIRAIAVITTATDINDKFSVDTWAKQNGFVIGDMTLAKKVSATILEKDVPLISDFKIVSEYPSGVEPKTNGEIGICISWERKAPFGQTLNIVPPVLHLGIGCRKGVKANAIHDAVDSVLSVNNIDKRAIKCVASIDIKAEECGILEYCRENSWQINFYTADELKSAIGEFSTSDFVQDITGVDNVCERAAMMNAKKMVVRKTAMNGVTVAIAAEELEVRFG